MVKVILAALAALIAVPACAQSFPKPPDVPAYVAVTPTYASGTTQNVIGDGSSTGGTAPAAAYQLADIPTSPKTTWLSTGNSYGNGTGYCLTTLNGGSCTEAKTRFHANGTHIGFNDPIRNYGQPNTSHCHTFFGNGSVNAYSTYASLRNRGVKYSAAAGGPINSTGYWYPCVQKDGVFGGNWVVKPNYVTIYYSQDPADSLKTHYIVNGLRYVTGFNMDSGDEGTFMANAVATANAQPGTSGRYSLTSLGNFEQGHVIWCAGSNGASSKWFKNANGTDPWGGTCTAGMDMYFQVTAAHCWDGVNLWSPSGYYHVIPRVWDTLYSKWVCPNGWYSLPKLTVQIHFTQAGFADYGTWYLSSDAMGSTAAGRTLNPGESFHTDWFGAWDQTEFRKWQTNCIAAGTLGATVPHECDATVLSSTDSLLAGGAAPAGTTGRNPQVDTTTTYGTGSASVMWKRPATPTASATMHMHGN